MTNDFKMTNVRNLLILDTLHFNPWAGGPPRTCVIDGARARLARGEAARIWDPRYTTD